jgi:hypothetical protein
MNDEAFYRRCWLTLKATNPRLRKRMTEIECGIEGIQVKEQTVLPKSEKKDAENTGIHQGGKEEIIPL